MLQKDKLNIRLYDYDFDKTYKVLEFNDEMNEVNTELGEYSLDNDGFKLEFPVGYDRGNTLVHENDIIVKDSRLGNSFVQEYCVVHIDKGVLTLEGVVLSELSDFNFPLKSKIRRVVDEDYLLQYKLISNTHDMDNWLYEVLYG